jgi:hypothetical protein
MAKDTRIVVQHLDEDIAPEHAQPPALREHGNSAAGGLVDRLKRPYLHTRYGSDRVLSTASGPPPGRKSPVPSTLN